MCMCVHLGAASLSQKREQDPLESKLQAAVSYPVLVAGNPTQRSKRS